MPAGLITQAGEQPRSLRRPLRGQGHKNPADPRRRAQGEGATARGRPALPRPPVRAPARGERPRRRPDHDHPLLLPDGAGDDRRDRPAYLLREAGRRRCPRLLAGDRAGEAVRGQGRLPRRDAGPLGPAMREMARRIRAGAIGEIVTGQSFFYFSGSRLVAPPNVSRRGPDPASGRGTGFSRRHRRRAERPRHRQDQLILKGHPVSAFAGRAQGLDRPRRRLGSLRRAP